MGHTVTVKLNNAAKEFQAGESMGFNVRGGVQFFNRRTKEKEWTNYSAVVFVRNEKQIDFYRNALVEGAIVEIGAKQLMINSFDGQNGTVLSIDMIDAWIGSINQSGQRQQAPQQQAPQEHKPQQDTNGGQADNNFDNFNDTIPF